MPAVSLSDMAGILEVTPKIVSAWVEDGLPVLGEGGRGKPRTVNTRAVVDWLIARERAKLATPDGGETLDAAKLRKARADADTAELEVRKATGELVPLADMEQLVARVMVLCATQLDALGGRLASALAGETDPAVVRQILFDETKRIRDAMSTEFENRAPVENRGEDDQTATEPDAGPVGESVPNPPARKRRGRPVAKRTDPVYDSDHAGDG